MDKVQLRFRAQSARHAVGPRGDLLSRFAPRTAVTKKAPIQAFRTNLGRSAAIVIAAVPFYEVGIDFRHRPEAGQLTCPHGATQRTGKYLRERQSFQSLPESSGVSLPLFGQRQIGEPRVLTRSAPGRGAVSRHVNDAEFFAFATVHADPSLPHFVLCAC